MKRHIAILLFAFGSINVLAQSVGIAGTVRGAVADPTGAAVVSAMVTLENEFTHYKQVKLVDESGKFVFTNIPPAPYHLLVSAAGFQLSHADVDTGSESASRGEARRPAATEATWRRVSTAVGTAGVCGVHDGCGVLAGVDGGALVIFTSNAGQQAQLCVDVLRSSGPAGAPKVRTLVHNVGLDNRNVRTLILTQPRNLDDVDFL